MAIPEWATVAINAVTDGKVAAVMEERIKLLIDQKDYAQSKLEVAEAQNKELRDQLTVTNQKLREALLSSREANIRLRDLLTTPDISEYGWKVLELLFDSADAVALGSLVQNLNRSESEIQYELDVLCSYQMAERCNLLNRRGRVELHAKIQAPGRAAIMRRRKSANESP